MGAELEQWKHCLVKSIQLFCRNFCQYDQEAKIDGLLAITLDHKEVILVKLQEVDNDASSQSASGGAATDQSELLESILRFLAPSCRLLKKTAIAATLPSVWQPVTDRSGSAEMPDRFTFLQSLGLAPTALVSNRKMETSYASRLRTRSSRRMMRSIPPFSYCPPPVRVSPKISELSAQEVNSEPPTLSPCPSRSVASVSKSECSEPSDDSTPLPALKRCVSDDEKKELVQQSPKSEADGATQLLTVDCNKNGANLNGVSHHSCLLNAKPASLLQMVKSGSCVGRDNASSSKKSPSCTSKDTDSLSGEAHDKPVQRPKKRSHTNAGSCVQPGESRPKSSPSLHAAAVKRVKAEATEIVPHAKSENGTPPVRTKDKADASRANKKLAKVRNNAGKCKLKTKLNAGSTVGRPVKATASASSKRIPLKSPATLLSPKDVKNAHRKLLNKTKVCLFLPLLNVLIFVCLSLFW